jgi:hypothetical protein
MSSLDVRVERVVSKSPPEVWAFVVDGFFRNHPRWDLALTECRSLDGEGATIKPGTRGVEVRRFGGEQRAEFRVTTVEAQRQFVFHNTSGPFELRRAYTFAPAASGTRLTFAFEMAPKGAMRLLFPLFRRTIRKQVMGNIDRLARLLEEGPR